MEEKAEEKSIDVRVWKLMYEIHERRVRLQYREERKHHEFVDLGGEA